MLVLVGPFEQVLAAVREALNAEADPAVSREKKLTSRGISSRAVVLGPHP